MILLWMLLFVKSSVRGKVDIYSDWEMTENYMQDIINQQPSDIIPVDEDKIKAEREWFDKNPDFGQYN